MWNSFIVVFVLMAAFADVRWRRIPRTLTVPAFAAGLIVHWALQSKLPWVAHYGDFLSAAATALLAFAIGLALFSLGAIGGGDVKLITALGAMLGFELWIVAMEIAILTAAFIGVVQIVRHHVVVQTLRNVVVILKSWLTSGFRPHPVINVKNAALVRSPFAVAAAVGTLFAVFR